MLSCFIASHQSLTDVNIPWVLLYSLYRPANGRKRHRKTQKIHVRGREKTERDTEPEWNILSETLRFEYPALPMRGFVLAGQEIGSTSGQINPKYSIQYLSSCSVWDTEISLQGLSVFTTTSPWVTISVSQYFHLTYNDRYTQSGHPSHHNQRDCGHKINAEVQKWLCQRLPQK